MEISGYVWVCAICDVMLFEGIFFILRLNSMASIMIIFRSMEIRYQCIVFGISLV